MPPYARLTGRSACSTTPTGCSRSAARRPPKKMHPRPPGALWQSRSAPIELTVLGSHNMITLVGDQAAYELLTGADQSNLEAAGGVAHSTPLAGEKLQVTGLVQPFSRLALVGAVPLQLWRDACSCLGVTKEPAWQRAVLLHSAFPCAAKRR